MLLLGLLPLAPSADSVTLRPTKSKPTPVFWIAGGKPNQHDLRTEAEGQNRELVVNGKRTGVVLPPEYELEVRCRSANGRVGGVVTHTITGGADWEVWRDGFATEEGNRVRWIPILPKAIDDRGRALATMGQTGANPDEQDPYIRRTGYLWDGRNVSDLGPAQFLRFRKDGLIEGFVVTDRSGKIMDEPFARQNMHPDADFRYRPFIWRSGQRSDGPLVRRRPFGKPDPI